MVKLLFPHPRARLALIRKFLGVRDPRMLRWLKRQELWHWNRDSVALSVLIGLLVAMLPIPAQMLLVSAIAVAIGAYLPLAIALVWLSNPITILPLSWMCLSLGCNLMQVELSLAGLDPGDNLLELVQLYWQPFLLGCLVSGLSLGLLGYYLTRWCWRNFAALSRRSRVN